MSKDDDPKVIDISTVLGELGTPAKKGAKREKEPESEPEFSLPDEREIGKDQDLAEVPLVKQWMTEEEFEYLWSTQGLFFRFLQLYETLRGFGLSYRTPTKLTVELKDILKSFLVNKGWAMDPKKANAPKPPTWW